MSAVIAKSWKEKIHQNLAELFCENSRRKVDRLFEDLWDNSDKAKSKIAKQVENDEFLKLDEGTVELSVRQKCMHTVPEVKGEVMGVKH